MSDDKVSLGLLGEQMLRMQADMRGIRSEQLQLGSEQTNVRADFMRLETKLDNFMASVDVRFNQVNETAGTNLAVTLSAIEKLSAKTDERFAKVEQTAADNLQTVVRAIEAGRS